MSIKKAIALSALLCVNVAILAHAAVPHRHHEVAGACFFNAHCEDCNYEHRELADNAYTPANKCTKNVRYAHISCDCGQTLYAITHKNTDAQDFTPHTITHFWQKPDVPSLYSAFVASSVGLRAPPAC